MSSVHPRRSQKTTLSPMTLLSSHQPSPQSLRKGATFHSPPTSSSSSSDQHFIVPSLPRRSESSLEDVIEAHKRRVALTLGDIETRLSAIDLAASPPTDSTFRDDSLPLPQGVLNHTVDTRRRDSAIAMSPINPASSDLTIGRHSLRPRRQARRQSRHASDSGLGSSVESKSDMMLNNVDLANEQGSKSMVSASAVNRFAAARPSTFEKLPGLSAKATKTFQQFILQPLLGKSSLKDFHPLVADCPRRIKEKEIVCLRDLEKTLMFMAPENAATAKLYVDFCIESIRCIQATVEHLGDRELTRPNDRPYTSGYFIDLVDQIRNYAHSLQTGEKSGDNESVAADADSKESEQVRLYGGLNKNGRPAELVRITKDGKAFSLASGEEIPMADIEEDERRLNGLKRSLTEDADDESILRSMARRKASATEMAPKVCREAGCGKHFKRACDLTKHEKTHSRPWKCHDTNCRYHDYGWPTEKELDRHNNDKHAANPKLYKCLYTPCPYSSKRESNCKQHMEKSHGWTYVRSKNNGKNRGLPTPQDTNLQTPVTDHHPSPQQSIFGGFEQTGSLNGDVFNDGHSVGASSYNPDVHYSNDMVMTEPQQFISPADSNLQLTSNESSPYFNNYQEFPPANNATLNFGGNGNDFTLYEDLYNAAAFVPQPQIPQFHQQPSPDQSIFTGSYKSPAPVQSWDMAPLMSNNNMPHLSPIGQGNCDTMLYTPASMMDVDDSFEFTSGDDFPLFSNTNVPAPAQNMSLFGEVPSNATGMSQMQSQGQWDEFYNTAYIQPYDDEALDMLKFEN